MFGRAIVLKAGQVIKMRPTAFTFRTTQRRLDDNPLQKTIVR